MKTAFRCICYLIVVGLAAATLFAIAVGLAAATLFAIASILSLPRP